MEFPQWQTISQGYSKRAAETRETILEQVVEHFSGCMMMSEFPQRVEDMWNGVLAEDFIFSFRNSLAAKAYIEVEQEYTRQTLKAEENLSLWVNQSCNIQIQNCTSEHDLDSCITELHTTLKQKVHDLLTQELQSLKTFFEKHRLRDIAIQWKSEKEISLKLFCETEERRISTQMENMRIRRLFKLHQQREFHDHEQKIMKQAVSLAEGLRGKCPSDKELTDEFDSIWNKFESQMVFTYSLPPSNVILDLDIIFGGLMRARGYDKYLHDQYKLTPLVPDASLNTITQHDISKDHIMVKSRFQDISYSRTHFVESAAGTAKEMMDTVVKRIQEICEHDIMFDKLHGRQIFDLVLKRVTDYNAVQEEEFSFTPCFIAFFIVRVACYAATYFDKMNQRFEERHGIQAKLNHYRPRVFLLFQNTAHDKAAELVLAANFCEAIKQTLLEFVQMKVDLRIGNEIYQRIGTLKYDMITKMLDEFLQERSFTKLYEYVHHPFESANMWMQGFGNDLLFSQTNGITLYSEFVNCFVDEIIGEVRSSTEAASEVTLSMAKSGQVRVPEAEQLSISQTDQPNTPQTEQPSAPLTNQTIAPLTDQLSAPQTVQLSTRQTDQPSTSQTDQLRTPKTHQPSTPDRDQRSTPQVDKPNTPKAGQLKIWNKIKYKIWTDQPGTIQAEMPSTPEKDQMKYPETDQHSIWIRIFCEKMKNTALIDPSSLEVTTNYKISHFKHYQQALDESLQQLEDDMNDELLRTTAETVKWADIKSPFQKVCDRLWGCTALCPFCNEPCQHSDPNHKISHQCIQHRPTGFRGTMNSDTQYLKQETCNTNITTLRDFFCDACQYRCRKSGHCNNRFKDKEKHPYREYKKFLPDWDIAPDPTGEASKFWQWAMHTYQEDLLKKYEETKITRDVCKTLTSRPF